MRSAGTFDGSQCSYGPGTEAMRSILAEWRAVDWFVSPPPGAGTAARALFEEHHAKGRTFAPDLFPERIEVQAVRGGWDDFAELGARVRSAQGWDWKFSVLKPLSSRHTQASGRSLADLALDMAELGPDRLPGAGDLFLRNGDSVIVCQSLAPSLDLRSALPPLHAEVGDWYAGYTGMDVLEAITWQLTARSDRLDDNPYVPLLRCYAAGYYPFGLGPSKMVLFAF